MPILVKVADVRSGTEVKARHGWLQPAQTLLSLIKLCTVCHMQGAIIHLEFALCSEVLRLTWVIALYSWERHFAFGLSAFKCT